MTNEEKILLVLEMLGVDSVAKAKKELTELNKALDETKQAADQASGKGGGKGGGVNAGGLLTVAYALDDLQYGLKGVVNNIPQVVQALGMGAGLAGAISIAAVGINQLVQRHPEWFEWSEKIKVKLGEVVSKIEAEEAAIKRQREAVDKLSQSNTGRLEDLNKLIQKTDELKAKEEQLNKQRADIKTGENQAKNVGVLQTEELGKLKTAFQESILDTGNAKAIQDVAIANRMKEYNAGVTDDYIKKVAKSFGRDYESEVSRLADPQQVGRAILPPQMDRDKAEEKVMTELRRKFRDEIQRRIKRDATSDVMALMGGIQNAQTPDEVFRLSRDLERLNPEAGKAFGGQYQTILEDERFNKAIAGRQAANARRRTQISEEMAAAGVGPSKEAFLANELKTSTIDANIRNTVLGQFDPLTMALFRRQQAGTGRDAQRNLAALESRDVEFYSQALVTQGMDAGRARQAAMESLRGGESSFQQMAAGMGLNVRNVNQGFEASVNIMERLMQENEEQKMKTMMLMQRLNIMDQGNGAPARPQMNRVPR